MIHGAFSRRAGLAPMLALVGALLFGSAVSGAAQQVAGFSGWAKPPDVGSHLLLDRDAQPLPGWQAVSKTDARVKVLKLRGPRAFGVLVGDKVRLELLVAVEKPYRVQRSSLPPSRWINSWLELQTLKLTQTRGERLNRYTIAVNYQIFATPRAVTLDTIPGFELRFVGAGEKFALAVPHWVFSMSPLLKPEPEVDSVAAIPVRADAPPLLADTTLPEVGTAVFGVLSALLGSYWLYVNALWPFTRRKDAPFAHTCRRLRALKRRPREEQALPEGFLLIHQAFNQTAGEVVFAEHLERFFAKQPAFAKRRAEVEGFFHQSRRLFFGEGNVVQGDDTDLAWLESLCRTCRAAEREAG